MRCLRCDDEYEDTLEACPFCGEPNSASAVKTTSEPSAAYRRLIKREIRIYLLLAIVPFFSGLIALIIFMSHFGNHLSNTSMAIVFGLLYACIFGTFVYATIRLGKFLRFDTALWIIAGPIHRVVYWEISN